MVKIEFYYPTVTLTKTPSIIGNGFYFKDEINTSYDSKKLNFASKGLGLGNGTAIEYYVYNKDYNVYNEDYNKNYLVIKHIKSNKTIFYVMFPLTPTANVSDYLQEDRMNGGLAKSIDNLSILSKDKTKTKVNFSLESVINSMRTFNLDECNTSTYNSRKICLINEPIYVDNETFTDGLFAKDSELVLKGLEWTTISDLTIAKVTKVSSCTYPKKVDKSKKGLFENLNETDQLKNNYLNLALMLMSLSCFTFFYWLYRVKGFWLDKGPAPLFYFLTAVVFIIMFPIWSSAQILDFNNSKIDNTELRNSITFARYVIVTFGMMIFSMFSKEIIDFFKNKTPLFTRLKQLIDQFMAKKGQDKAIIFFINLFVIGLFGFLFYMSYYIFLKV